ncbi:unnamed protein product [Notodromas monacha]|uniref:AB hydrolase-1 domain-containing protein n=1 Tax=Notodromas monacha TaxID=399045 RepID=A0A7R9C0I9_9CRUS|nr:unnamed protein product [Notodromas monacha]CAG0923944.1 unnamed protein product [Notodromas monacha]
MNNVSVAVQVGEDVDIIPNYIYHCNAQNPSGEGAFHAMSMQFGWAKDPMLARMDLLDPSVPITLIYGAGSWISSEPGARIKEKRGESVRLEKIASAGHHVYADRADLFNDLVNEVCENVDLLKGTAAEIESKKEAVSATPKMLCNERLLVPKFRNIYVGLRALQIDVATIFAKMCYLLNLVTDLRETMVLLAVNVGDSVTSMAGKVVDAFMRLGMPGFSTAAGRPSVGNRTEVKECSAEGGDTNENVEPRVEDKGILALPWNWYNSWRWCPTSEAHVAMAETRIMSRVESKFTGKQVDFFSPYDSSPHHVWTLCFESDNKSIPLVLVHGFGNGAAFWCMNFDSISKSRNVYAVDMPGFARSSRPKFCTDAQKIEEFYVHSLEEWRRQMNLEKFILLGHSMGGFVVSRYATTYPERVAHLILVDPWGLSKIGEGIDWSKPIPLWIRSTYLTRINPLRIVRAFGPLGPIVSKIGAYYAWNRYSWFLKDEASAMADYLFHGNVLARSGEDAFQALTHDLFWAKNPALDELIKVDPALGISFVYGAQSWLDSTPAEMTRAKRPGGFVGLDVVENSGHDIFADAPQEFNRIVNKICENVEVENR